MNKDEGDGIKKVEVAKENTNHFERVHIKTRRRRKKIVFVKD